ncbi:hypothetical protein [Bacillus alkalicellulosilyticus]|uniref:hypothetical protein n=1 Tax=Alkalihalobacterium alkalicellulosilyticum TaxID=1912214 RepID=UPI000997B468|nr:hypothetical protein [Bacillus alkalicellulosilyticus]
MLLTIDDLPKKVYKFMTPSRLNSLSLTSQIYINHLNNYPEDMLGKEIGDNLEGHLNSHINIGDYTFGKKENAQQQNIALDNIVQDLGFISYDNTSTIHVTNSSFTNKIVDNNYFVYCVCLSLDNSVKREFGGAMQVIHDFPRYIKALTMELENRGIELFDAGACEYISKRKQVFTEKDKEIILKKPYLIKDKRYEYQLEYRVLWKYKNNRIINEPVKINSREALNKYCSLTLK